MAIYDLRLADQEPFFAPLPLLRFPISPFLPMSMGCGSRRSRGLGLHMRVPDSCELETTADLQIPGEITPYRLMSNCVVFLFAPLPGDLKSLYVIWDDL